MNRVKRDTTDQERDPSIQSLQHQFRLHFLHSVILNEIQLKRTAPIIKKGKSKKINIVNTHEKIFLGTKKRSLNPKDQSSYAKVIDHLTSSIKTKTNIFQS